MKIDTGSTGLVAAAAKLTLDLIDEIGQEALVLALVRRLLISCVGRVGTSTAGLGSWRGAVVGLRAGLRLWASLGCDGSVWPSC